MDKVCVAKVWFNFFQIICYKGGFQKVGNFFQIICYKDGFQKVGHVLLYMVDFVGQLKQNEENITELDYTCIQTKNNNLTQ
jgi:hypothetical protein